MLTKFITVLGLVFIAPGSLRAQEAAVEDVIEDLNDAAEQTSTDSDEEYQDDAINEDTEEDEDQYEDKYQAETSDDHGVDRPDNITHSMPSAPISSDPAGASSVGSHVAKRASKVNGIYRIHLGAAKPVFKNSDEYELIYGNTKWIPTLGVDYFFFDWFATLGTTFRMGYYKDEGTAVIQDGSSFSEDVNGDTEITLVPLQVALIGQITPFPARWVSLSAWFGGEVTYFQEIRLSNDSESSAARNDDDSNDDDKVLTNTGWRYASVVGVALSFQLNGLDERSISSLHPIGIGGVYLSPYTELITGIGNEAFDLSRTTIGAAFTFESL